MNKEYRTSGIITPATPEDAAAIEHIASAVWIATYPNESAGITENDIRNKFLISSDEEAKHIEEREKRIREDQLRRYWIVKVGEDVAGYCVAVKGRDVNTLQALNILPPYQGQGLGTRLMEQACEWLGNDLPISLRVVAYNEKAIEFYKKLGFSPSGRNIEVDDNLLDGKSLPRIEMIRPQ